MVWESGAWLEDGRALAASVLERPVTVTAVRASHHERVAFEALAGAERVFVKAELLASRSVREEAALRTLAAAGVSVPRVLAVADDGHLRVLVLSMLGGEPLQRVDGPERWRQMGAVVRAIHDTPPPREIPPIDAEFDSYAAFLHDWSRVDRESLLGHELLPVARVDELSRKVRSLIAELDRPRFTLTHGDCQPDHFFVESERIHVVDLGETWVADPILDLVIVTLDDTDLIDVVLDGYGADAVLRQQFDERRELYTLMRCMGATRWLADHGFDPKPYLDLLERL